MENRKQILYKQINKNIILGAFKMIKKCLE